MRRVLITSNTGLLHFIRTNIVFLAAGLTAYLKVHEATHYWLVLVVPESKACPDWRLS